MNEVLTFVIHILQMEKLKHREAKSLAQGHTARKQQGQGLNPEGGAPETMKLFPLLECSCLHYPAWHCLDPCFQLPFTRALPSLFLAPGSGALLCTPLHPPGLDAQTQKKSNVFTSASPTDFASFVQFICPTLHSFAQQTFTETEMNQLTPPPQY